MGKTTKKPSGQFQFGTTTPREGVELSYSVSKQEPATHTPNLDMFSTPALLTIEVELPGVRKEDIELSACRSTLTVRAVKFECFDEEKVNYLCMERGFGVLFRTVDIPFPVDTSRIKAVYKNGILSVTIPRVEDKRAAARRVQVDSD